MTDTDKVMKAMRTNDKDFMCALAIGQHGENAQRLMITVLIELISAQLESGAIAPVKQDKPKEWKH
jgi:hypothetical protein